MQKSTAKILNENLSALSIAASAGRISTQEGTALEIYARSGDREKDLKLLGKVLSSGHESVIEHQTVSVAFNDVSVMVEQFVIEFRLASFTVKSRRYVNFAEAGYVVPEALGGEARAIYCDRAEALFQDYARLLELGVPKEDARFLFPYCLRSNFFMTLNARELIRMIRAMLFGRGARFEEIRHLGEQLKEQFEKLIPGVIGERAKAEETVAPLEKGETFREGQPVVGDAALLSGPSDAEALLSAVLSFGGRFASDEVSPENMARLLNDARPRELETLNYTFRISDVSLACVTHFTRHRIQSPMIPELISGLYKGDYVLPESVRTLPEAERIYRKAFEDQAEAANHLKAMGVPAEILTYMSMSGHVIDLLLTMNARELLLFSKLRTCSRAQWEIRAVARKMVLDLNRVAPKIFSGYGPSCAVTGRCPEGRMCCGHPVRIENGVWKVQE